jgi:hypothetical protein
MVLCFSTDVLSYWRGRNIQSRPMQLVSYCQFGWWLIYFETKMLLTVIDKQS